MNRSIKIFLLWLLMLALPLQAYAAAAVSIYDTTPLRDVAAVSDRVGAAASGLTEHCAGHGKQYSADRSHAPDDASSAKDAGSSASGSCPVCFAGAAILPSALIWHLPMRQQNLPLAYFDILFSGHIPAGLERPPRSILI